MVIVGGLISVLFSKAEANAQKAYAGAGSVATEVISAMRTVQAFNLQDIAV